MSGRVFRRSIWEHREQRRAAVRHEKLRCYEWSDVKSLCFTHFLIFILNKKEGKPETRWWRSSMAAEIPHRAQRWWCRAPSVCCGEHRHLHVNFRLTPQFMPHQQYVPNSPGGRFALLVVVWHFDSSVWFLKKSEASQNMKKHKKRCSKCPNTGSIPHGQYAQFSI